MAASKSIPSAAAAAAAVVFLCVCGFFPVVLSQKETNLQFYMHDRLFTSNPTAIPVAGPNGSTTSNTLAFGTVFVIDDAITEGDSNTSRALGRGQGTYMVSSLNSSSLLLTFTAVFSDRNGTLSFHGADTFLAPSREIAVVGGTGIFRFAQGYAVITTVSSVGSSAVLNFNVTFRHSDEIKGSSNSSTTSSGSGSSPPSIGENNSSAVASPNYWSFVTAFMIVASLLQRRLL